jgi:hypothetical protein
VPITSKGLLVIWPGINSPGDPTNLVQSCIGIGGAKAYALVHELGQSCSCS